MTDEKSSIPVNDDASAAVEQDRNPTLHASQPRATDPQKESIIIAKHFWCSSCGAYHQTTDFTEPEGRKPVNELDYYSKCEKCGDTVKAVPHYYANLPKMHTTGPKTAEGKARSSMNGMKHGLYAQPHHLLAPANGKYDICQECQALEACEAKQLKYCPFKTDLLLKFLTAYENGEVGALKQYAGLTQGRLYVLLERSLSEVMQTGVLLKSLKVSNGQVVYEKKKVGDGDDAEFVTDLDKPIFEYKSNPILDVLPRMMEALGMTSNQQEMNPHSQAEDGGELEGNLKAGAMDMDGFSRMMSNLLSGVNSIVKTTAEAMRSTDEVAKSLETGDKDSGTVESSAPEQSPFKK